jgi:CDP-diacylglycerol--glycerol-3-phosphate 3-phosphatidyltransferase
MISIYEFKPRFQMLLRPLVRRCAERNITANSITIIATVGSVVVGSILVAFPQSYYFAFLPVWMFLRMALNAIDGMLAREFGQQTPLGAYLNELSDVISDAALYLPFVVIKPFGWGSIGLVIFLSTLSEMAGVIGQATGGSRRYDGPMGKSDRAFVFGAIGLWLAVAGNLPDWAFWIMPLTASAIVLNIFNRIRNGIPQARR